MYSLIKDYFDLRIAEFNTANSNYLVETSISLNKNRLPLNQKQANYAVKLDNYNDSPTENEGYEVNGLVELTFSMVNKQILDYETVQTYIHNLVRYIRRNEAYYTGGKNFRITSIGAEELNNINEGSTELNPVLKFTGEYIDSNPVGLSAPSTPTLTSPVNDYSSGLLNQPFNWSSVSNATSYTFELSNTGGVILTQTNLTSSSFTIPADNLLTDGQTYTWRVKAIGEGGSSAWTSYWTFTVSDNPMPAVPVLDLPLDGATGTGSTTFMWSTSDNAETYDIQISTDVGFGTTLVDETGLTASYYAYTFTSSNTYFWRVRAVNGYGTSDWTDSRNVVEILPVPDYRTGLVAEWLATSGVTSDENGVSAWVDTISSRSATQSTTANKPFYCANQKNGLPVIRFTTNRWLTFSSLALTNFTVIIGYKASSFQAGNSNYLLAGSGMGIFSAINALSIGYGEFDGTRIRAVTYNGSDTTWHIRSFQNQKLYSNGTEPTYSGYAQNLTGMTLTTIGTRSDNTGLYFSGDIAFIRVYDSVLSTTDRATAETYLNSIYSIY